MNKSMWHTDETIWDLARAKFPVFNSHSVRKVVRQQMISLITSWRQSGYTPTERDADKLLLQMGDFVFETFGRRRWYISREVFQIVSDLPLCAEPSSIPYDVLNLVFENGCILDGKELRFSTVMKLCSEYSKNLVKDVCDGLLDPSGLFDVLRWNVTTTEASFDKEWTPTNDLRIKRIVFNALALVEHRPEFLAEIRFPKNERGQLPGHLPHSRRVLLPDAKYIAEHKNGTDSHGPVEGHVRRAHIRVLYRGTDRQRTTTVKMCLVNGGPKELRENANV